MGSIDTAPTMNGQGAKYEYGRHELGQERPIHLIIIGAGVSTIGAVKMFKERFAEKKVRLTIYEKNHDVGGTWLENRYPG
jgi:cation diffusion facilitator CzcD-associated flavoprotein CzcO